MLKNRIVNVFVACYILFLITLICLIGLGFAVAGFYMLMLHYFISWAAALITALAIFLAGGVICLIYKVAGYARDSTPEPGDDVRSSELVSLALEVMEDSQFSARDAVVVALFAGAIVGASPDLRQQIFTLFRAHREANKTAKL